MNFSDVMREESKWAKTENGADAKNTTDSALLDMFATIGSMRSRSEDEIIQKFELAFQEDPLGAMRCLFWVRDCRGGGTLVSCVGFAKQPLQGRVDARLYASADCYAFFFRLVVRGVCGKSGRRHDVLAGGL